MCLHVYGSMVAHLLIWIKGLAERGCPSEAATLEGFSSADERLGEMVLLV